jgi:molybdopterin converting factor small subunit
MKVLTYGLIAEKAGGNELELEEAATTVALIEQLEIKHPFLKEMKYVVAVNQEIVKGSHPIHATDEIALLPPFAGG